MKNLDQGKREIVESSTGRLFFALWPDVDVARSLAAVAQQQLRMTGGRQVRRENLHMTLLFLGSQSLNRLPQLQAAAAAVDATCFDMGIDCVAGWRHNRLGYAAPVVAPQALYDLVACLRAQVGAAGFAFDGKAFKPHVTLLRNTRSLLEDQEIALIQWKVKAFLLVPSVLTPEGACYRTLDRWPLKVA